MQHRRVVLGFVAAAVLLLTGCVQQSPRLITDFTGDAFAIVGPHQDVQLAALGTGHLVVDSNHCYAFEVNGTDTNVLWAPGTSFDRTGFMIPGIDHGLSEGSLISLGGGEVEATTDQAPCWKAGDTYWQMGDDAGSEGMP